jgi:hypothetical protein
MVISLVVCLLCWVAGYFFSVGFPLTDSESASSLWRVVDGIFINKGTAYFIGMLSVVIIGFTLQKINNDEMFIEERTRLPLIIFLFFYSTNSALLPVSEVIIVLFCIDFFFYEFFKSYQKPEDTLVFYNAGTYLGIASLFMPQVLWFVPLMWTGMYSFRSLSFKSFFSSLLSVMTIYWIALAWCLWSHDFTFLSEIFNSFINVNLPAISSFLQYYKLGFLLLVIIIFVYVKLNSIEKSVRLRIMLSFLIRFSVLTIFLIFIYDDKSDLLQAILYLPACILVSYYFATTRHRFRFVLYYFMIAFFTFSFFTRIWTF